MYIKEKFNENHKFDYFAMQFLVKITYDKYNKKKYDIVEEAKPFFIRKANYDDEDAVDEIRCEKEKYYEEQFMILPKLLMEDEQERDVLYLSASAGSGKSYFVNMFSKIYHMYYPQNDIYFLTLNDFKADKSLDHKLYKQIDMNDFIDSIQHSQEQFAKDGKLMANSLIIFDDIGALKDDKKREKTVWSFIDTILENKRKSKIGICCISHVPTNYKLTSVLVRETEWYIVFPSNQQVKSDRFLNTYLGLNKKQIHRITEEEDHSRWIAIATKKKTVVSQYVIYSLKLKQSV